MDQSVGRSVGSNVFSPFKRSGGGLGTRERTAKTCAYVLVYVYNIYTLPYRTAACNIIII